MTVDGPTRRQLALLARRKEARTTDFHPKRPTKWQPRSVENPEGRLDRYFTDPAAWELIASRLDADHPVEPVRLRQPPGATGYVMKIRVAPRMPPVYVKLQLGAGKIIGRSFHYSEPQELKDDDR